MDERANPAVLKKALEERVRARDAQVLDPEERAEAVNEFFLTTLGEDEISGELYWDILSFCVHFISHAAVASGDEIFLENAKLISQWLYSTHYSYSQDHSSIKSSRVERLEYWISQVRQIEEALDGVQPE